MLTMRDLARRCADSADELGCVTVVDDQLGRLTFTDQMAEGIFWLLGYRGNKVEPSVPAPFGTYNLTGSGRVASWAEIARVIFETTCDNGDAVIPVTTTDYYASVEGPVAPRPVHSDLDLSKLAATGFLPRNWEDELTEYLSNLEEV